MRGPPRSGCKEHARISCRGRAPARGAPLPGVCCSLSFLSVSYARPHKQEPPRGGREEGSPHVPQRRRFRDCGDVAALSNTPGQAIKTLQCNRVISIDVSIVIRIMAISIVAETE